jgi:hypothetical protein
VAQPDTATVGGKYFGMNLEQSDDPSARQYMATRTRERADGGLDILDEPEAEAPPKDDFDANLAERMDEQQLQDFATFLMERIERDRESRKQRDEQYREGIARSGMSKEAPGGAQFQGASRVVHPMIAESCVDFTASAIKELFPADGPVRTQIIGRVTREKIERADRKKTHMNWQLTTQCAEYRGELEQLLTQLPLGGSQYMKLYWDTEEDRPRTEFVAIDDLLMPYAASNFYTSPRVTQVLHLTDLDIEQRIVSGLYRDIDIGPPPITQEKTRSAESSEKVEGKTDESMGQDGLRDVYECYHFHRFTMDKRASSKRRCPYITTIDLRSRKVLAIRRNWDKGDKRFHKLDWIVDHQFIPWRGAVGVGLTHLVGTLAAAATGAIRALLDSAHINNAATMLKLKGARFGGQSDQVEITQVKEVEGPANVDDIRKIAMPFPFNPPSPVLFQLLGWLDAAARGVISTAEEKIKDATNNGPVGTTQALIEQGAKVFAAIHARLHDAQKRTLAILHRLNRLYLDEKVIIRELGDLIVQRADYEGPVDVIPVSDPNIFSETQRYAQAQATLQLQTMAPQLYDTRAVHRRVLQMLKVPGIEEILPDPQPQVPTNPVVENLQMMMGKPAQAFPDQEHLAHIQVHVMFMQDPMTGGLPNAKTAVMQHVIEHLKQHVGFWYVQQVIEVVSESTGQDIRELMSQDIDVSAEFDQLLAAAVHKVHADAQRTLSSLPPLIMQAMQQLQSMQPPMPMDPSQAQVAISQQETQIEMQEIQRRTQKDQMDQQFRTQQLAQQAQADQDRNRTSVITGQQDNQTELQVNREKIAADQQTEGMKHQTEVARIAQEGQQNAGQQQLDAAKINQDRVSNFNQQRLDAARLSHDRTVAAGQQQMDAAKLAAQRESDHRDSMVRIATAREARKSRQNGGGALARKK